MKPFASVLVAIGLFSGLSGCSSDENDSRIRVVCTTPQVADMVRSIGGDRISVTTLLEGEGMDPHTSTPTQDDISALARADVIFYSGHHLEGKFDSVLKKMGEEKTVIALAEALPEEQLLKGEEGEIDPHVWFDAALWSLAVEPVKNALAEVDPEHAEEYASRAEDYRKTLLELDEFAKTEIQKIPQQQRVLVTAHDAFSYFANAYGMKVESIQGISTEAEPSVEDINKLVSYLVENRIPAIFVERSVNSRTVESTIQGCRNHPQKHILKEGGSLYSDSMGNPGTSEGTYEGMFRYNVNTIVEALQ